MSEEVDPPVTSMEKRIHLLCSTNRDQMAFPRVFLGEGYPSIPIFTIHRLLQTAVADVFLHGQVGHGLCYVGVAHHEKFVFLNCL